MLQHVGRRDVAVRARHALLPQLWHDMLVEIDHVQLCEQMRAVVLTMSDQHGGHLVEAQEDDVAVNVVGTLFLGARRVAVDGGAPAEGALRGAGEDAVDRVVVADHEGRQDGEEREGPDQDGEGVLVDVPVGHAQAADHEGELRDLGEVDRRDCAQSLPTTEQIDHREDADPTHDQHDDRDEASLPDGIYARGRDLHAEADEEEGDEEVPDVLDLSIELRAIRECRQGDP
mmetsp:Transcript_77180/g.194086  ORF Transcript_77180/g.194086 Transcript_77180/m.194086 type:complete len:230 (-) Transcript_77180:62-751(-)